MLCSWREVISYRTKLVVLEINSSRQRSIWGQRWGGGRDGNSWSKLAALNSDMYSDARWAAYNNNSKTKHFALMWTTWVSFLQRVGRNAMGTPHREAALHQRDHLMRWLINRGCLAHHCAGKLKSPRGRQDAKCFFCSPHWEGLPSPIIYIVMVF